MKSKRKFNFMKAKISLVGINQYVTSLLITVSYQENMLSYNAKNKNWLLKTLHLKMVFISTQQGFKLLKNMKLILSQMNCAYQISIVKSNPIGLAQNFYHLTKKRKKTVKKKMKEKWRVWICKSKKMIIRVLMKLKLKKK